MTRQMIKIYHTYIIDRKLGENQGMFDASGQCLGWWSCDDADWRGEYFSDFMGKLGIEIVGDSEMKEQGLDPKKLKKQLKEIIKKSTE